MSRLDDLIDLIQTTNEVYFITAPGRVRTAFILVDDIVELALKSYLQAQVLVRQAQCIAAVEAAGIIRPGQHRRQLEAFFEGRRTFGEFCNEVHVTAPAVVASLQAIMQVHALPHWSLSDPDARKQFHEVANEVADLHAPGHAVHDLLNNVQDRRRTRNRFFHDPDQSGLTIPDETCLRALCHMFSLKEELFPDFRTRLQHSFKTVRCQIGVLRLKLAAHGSSELAEQYNEALDQLKKGHRYDFDRRSVEHSILHTVSDLFFAALHEQFLNEIAKLQTKIDRIDPQPSRSDQRAKRSTLIRKMGVLRQQLTDIESLGIP